MKKILFSISVLLFVFSITVHADSIKTPMRLGDTDKTTAGSVSKLQLQLSISPTGYFGIKTKKKIQEFQKKNNLRPTGVFDTYTRDLMFSAPLATEIKDNDTVRVSGNGIWEYQTLQNVYIPKSIQKQIGKYLSIRLISKNAFQHGDVYYIVLQKQITKDMNSFMWVVGTTTAQSVASGEVRVPSGTYALELCVDASCVPPYESIVIPRIKAPQDDKAVMASISTGGLYYNYIIDGDMVIDEISDTYPVYKISKYKGEELSIKYRTKEKNKNHFVTIYLTKEDRITPLQVLYSGTSSSTVYKWNIPPTATSGVYMINVCIDDRCNFVKEKLDIKEPILRTVSMSSSTISYPSYLNLYKTNPSATSSSLYTFRSEGVIVLKVSEKTGDLFSFSNWRPQMERSKFGLETYSYQIAGDMRTLITMVKLNDSYYVSIEGRPELVFYVVNSIQKK